jgi:hypothetical protein
MIARLLALGAMLSLTACGPSAGPTFPIDLFVSAALNDQLSGFQISVVNNGSALDCVAVQKSCIKDQVEKARFVPLKTASGKTGESIGIALALTAGSPTSQDLTLTDLPVGKDFALVIEAVSKDSAAKLVGSSCSYLKELSAGPNAAVFAQIETLTPPAPCDPRH